MRLGFVALTCVLFFGVGCASKSQVRPDDERGPSKRVEDGPRELERGGLFGGREPVQEGVASWYGAYHQGKKTASGQPFDKEDLTAAHRTLKFGTCVRVRNVGNGREVQVRVNDRGPYAKNRVIDVSEAAARELGMIEKGIARVQLFPCR